MKKLTKRQIQAQNTQQRVYKTAVALMSEKGFQNITVSEICKKAGVSVGTFYNYFESKNDILDEIFKLADDYFYNMVSNQLTGSTAEDKIIEFFHAYAKYNFDNGIDFIKQLFNVHTKVFKAKGRHMQTVLKDIIIQGQKNGEIHGDMSSDEIVEYLFIAVRGIIYDWCLHDGEYDLIEFVNKYVKRLVKIFVY